MSTHTPSWSVDPVAHQLEADILQAQKRLAQWSRVRHLLAPLDAACRGLNLEPMMSGDWYVVHATGDAVMLRSIVTIISDAGYSTTEPKPKAGDSSWSPLYSHPDVDVCVYLNFTSSVCKRIQVGIETKEVPIYKTVCGDFAALEDAETVLDLEVLT